MAVVHKDLLDALEHASEHGEEPRDLHLQNFSVSPTRMLPMREAHNFDDVGAWAEWQEGELAEKDADTRRKMLTSFRGKDWAARALSWTPRTMAPIVVVELRDGGRVIGDGRGRVSYAIGMGWPALPAVFLKEKRSAGRASGAILHPMANVNVPAALARASADLEKTLKQISMYTGVSAAQAVLIDNEATSIAVMAARIAAEARAARGDRSASRLVRAVRKALGFTNP